MAPSQTHKLKGTCDVCSASKVKCKKQKPTCSRCAKFGYQCCYSPAKRKGRPHPARGGDEQKDSSEAGDGQSEQKQDVAAPESMSLQAIPRRPDGKNYEMAAKTIPTQGELRQQESHKDVYLESPITRCPQDTPAWINSLNIPSFDNIAARAFTDEPSSIALSQPHIEDMMCALETTCSDTINVSPSVSDSSKHSNIDDCADCGTMALKELQHLTSISKQPLRCLPTIPTLSSFSSSSHSTSQAQFDGVGLNARINTAAAAITRLSRILACPCSGKIDIGILNATLCTAILDTYTAILHYSTDSIDETCTRTSDFLHSGSVSNSVGSSTAPSLMGCASESDAAEGLHSKVNDQIIVRRVFEELPKVANLVMQFTQRYSTASGSAGLEQGKEEWVVNLLSTLATSQKSRLRNIIDKVTDWLMQSC